MKEDAMGSDVPGPSSALNRPARGQAGDGHVSDPSPELNLDWTLNLVESFFAAREVDSQRVRTGVHAAG
jgi:hypothetical protein